MFKEFSSFWNAKVKNENGTGLGLMICKTLIGRLGPYEDIKVISEEGVGSQFSFLIY